MMEDWVTQFEELAGSQDMESIVETMMQQLLSKEILHEPMKEIGERYPKWLKEHKAGLSSEDYERYSHQNELIRQLNVVYKTYPNNFTKIVNLMQKMQECANLLMTLFKSLLRTSTLQALASYLQRCSSNKGTVV